MTVLSFAHAFTPNEQATYGGGEHLVVDGPFVAGRLRREKGDALCKPSRKFWGLHSTEQAWKICKRCRELAERYGLVVPPLEGELDARADGHAAALDDAEQVALQEACDDGGWPRVFDGDHARMHQTHGRSTAASRLQTHGLLDDRLAPTPMGRRVRRRLGPLEARAPLPEPQDPQANAEALRSLFRRD